MPLTSKITSLLPGEFVLSDWGQAGLNVLTAVKRGWYTVHQSLIAKMVGKLSELDTTNLDEALSNCLGI